jgi:hypothetical protein
MGQMHRDHAWKEPKRFRAKHALGPDPKWEPVAQGKRVKQKIGRVDIG